jgi:hypothetical protein
MTMTLAMPTPPTRRATAPSPEEERGVGRFCRGPGLDDVGGAADLHLLWVFGVGRRGQEGAGVLDRVGVGADVDRGGVGGGAEELLGDRVADEGGAVDVGGERERVEDADDAEPAPVDVDGRPGLEARDRQPLRRDGAERDGGVADICLVQEEPLLHRSVQGGEQVGVRREDADPVCPFRGDVVAVALVVAALTTASLLALVELW